MTEPVRNSALNAVVALMLVAATAAAAGAAEAGAQPAAGPSCADKDSKIAEQAAELLRLHKRVEQLEEELDLSDIE